MPSLILFLETITTVRKIEGGFRCHNKKLVFGGEPEIGVGVGRRPLLGDFPRMELSPSCHSDRGPAGKHPTPTPHPISLELTPAWSAEALLQENAEC